MTNVFISYRRDDAGGHAGRLSDRLVARFGADRVFVDVDDIKPGQNFEQAIEQTLGRCDCLLAVVGPRWLESLRERAARHEDFVRHEIAVALSRGLTVIPVLVGGAHMPAAEDLPTELATFSRCQAVEIRDHRFDEDAGELLAFLGGPSDTKQPVARRAIMLAIPALVLLIAAGWFVWNRGSSTATLVPAPSIDGEWIAEMQRPGQPPYSIRLTLMRTADRISGVVRYPTGDGPIIDGHIEAGALTFHTEHIPQFESEPATVRVEGQFQGDAITLILSNNAGIATGSAHRVPVATARTLPSLAYGTWTLRNAHDDDGKNWSNSVLQFTSQEDTSDGLLLRGRFTWRLNDVLQGTEDFSGHYIERTRQVILEGSAVTDVPHRGDPFLAVGSYSAVLAPDERTLVQGRWGSTALNAPGVAGEWEATR